MRIIYMSNNKVGWRILNWLISEGESIVGLVVHPDECAKYKAEILDEVSKFNCPVWEGPALRNKVTIQALKELQPDLVLSVLFAYIIKKEVIDIPTKGCINLHNGFLPYNKGSYANVWSIVENTPAGATLHYIDEGIDTGDIISKRQVPILPADTGKTIYLRTEEACVSLFKDTWSSIKEGTAPRIPQTAREGSYHCTKDVGNIDNIDLERTYKACDLINILRARTFPPYEGAYFMKDGKKYFIQISIEEKTDE